MNLRLKSENRIEFANIYAVEFIGWGLLEDAYGRAGSFLSGSKLEVRYLDSQHDLSFFADPGRFMNLEINKDYGLKYCEL